MNYDLTDFYAYWINSIPSIGRKKISELVNEFGSYKAVYDASDNELHKLSKKTPFRENDINELINSKKDELIWKSYNKLQKDKIYFTYPGKVDYPDKLKQISDFPHILFYKGKLPQNDIPSVAVIGTRRCSSYGQKIAWDIGNELSKMNVQVISGMAIGIDTYAHKGAMAAKGNGYAVLGSGVDMCYPRSNIDLYMNLVEGGGVLSEFLPGTQAFAGNFPVRNRIISGLSDVVIVVEAMRKSGSLITVNFALDQNKDVMAVPGRVGDVFSEGCNDLLRQGAMIYTDIGDVLDLLGISFVASSEKINNVLAREDEIVYGSICLIPKSLDSIIEETGLSADKVNESVINLMLINYIEEVGKNNFVRTHSN